MPESRAVLEIHSQKKMPLIQTSIRLHPDIVESMRVLAEKKNISQSDIIRAAVGQLDYANNLPENEKLATVDVTDHKGRRHFRVTSWIES